MAKQDRPVGHALRRFRDAWNKRSDRDDNQVGQLQERSERPIWSAISDVLHAYYHSDNHRSGQPPIEALPPDIAFTIADAIDELLTGATPEIFKTLVSRGRRNRPSEIKDKEHAVLYIRAFDKGIIEDPSPRRTVSEWFGMNDTRTLRRWLADETFDEVKPETSFPNDDLEDRPKLITTTARRSGEHWQAFKALRKNQKYR